MIIKVTKSEYELIKDALYEYKDSDDRVEDLIEKLESEE